MSNALLEVSKGLAGAVESAGLGVVQIDARRRMPASGIIWSSDGVIVSANHVVKRDDNIKVRLADEQSVSAAVAGRDPTTDLVVLRTETSDLSVPVWAESNDETLQVGHLVLALGRPGKTVQATLGIISAVGDSWRTYAGGLIDRYVQTDVVMYPGFSGGPLVDVNSQVLGLNSSALVRGVSVAIPASTVGNIVESVLAHGRVRRGYLGVSTQPVRLPKSLAETLGQETALLLVSVESGSPAEEGGLVLGDTIVSLDDNTVRQHDDLLSLLGAERVGKQATLKIVRGGQIQELVVVVGERS